MKSYSEYHLSAGTQSKQLVYAESEDIYITEGRSPSQSDSEFKLVSGSDDIKQQSDLSPKSK